MCVCVCVCVCVCEGKVIRYLRDEGLVEREVICFCQKTFNVSKTVLYKT